MVGSIRQRSKGRYQLRWTIEDPSTGKRKWCSKTVKGTKKQADAELHRILANLSTGTFVEPTKVTVRELLERWLKDDVPIRSNKDNTIESYARNVRLHIVPTLGALRLAKLTPAVVEKLYREKLDSGLSGTSVLGIHRTLHRALEVAVKWELVGCNVCDIAAKPKRRRVEYTTWTPGQARRFLDVAYDSKNRYYPLFATLIHSGLRIGEALGVRWSDLDLDNETLTIQQTLERAGIHPRFGTPKSGPSRRAVPIPSDVVATLKAWKAAQNEERLLFGPQYRDYGLIFTIPGGGPISRQNLARRDFTRLCALANVPRIRLHDTRHGYASTLMSAGVPMKTVSELLGHSSITITADTYGHIGADAKRGAAETFARILESANGG